MAKTFNHFRKPKQLKESRQQEMFTGQGPSTDNKNMQNYINVAQSKFKSKVKRQSVDQKNLQGDKLSNTYSYQMFDMKDLNARRASYCFRGS